MLVMVFGVGATGVGVGVGGVVVGVGVGVSVGVGVVDGVVVFGIVEHRCQRGSLWHLMGISLRSSLHPLLGAAAKRGSFRQFSTYAFWYSCSTSGTAGD